ncbi:unnamed protein product, partial [Dovyalis caffra]
SIRPDCFAEPQNMPVCCLPKSPLTIDSLHYTTLAGLPIYIMMAVLLMSSLFLAS